MSDEGWLLSETVICLQFHQSKTSTVPSFPISTPLARRRVPPLLERVLERVAEYRRKLWCESDGQAVGPAL